MLNSCCYVCKSRCFLFISAWRLFDQSFYTKFLSELEFWSFEYIILIQVQNSNLQSYAVILNTWRCWLFCISVCFSCRVIVGIQVLGTVKHLQSYMILNNLGRCIVFVCVNLIFNCVIYLIVSIFGILNP